MKNVSKILRWLCPIFWFTAQLAFGEPYVIKVGASLNNEDGDPPRTAYQKANSNFLAQATPGGTADANGSMITDFALLADTNAVFYENVTAIQTPANRQSIAGLVAELKRHGVWNSLIDGIILKTNLGASPGAVVTLKGASCSTVGLVPSQLGMYFNGSASLSLSGLPDMRTNTVVAVVRNPGTGQNGVGGGAYLGATLIAFSDGTTNNEVRLRDDNYFEPTLTAAGLACPPGSAYLTSCYADSCVFDCRRHTVAANFSGTNVSGWIDGQPATMANTGSTNYSFNPANALTVPVNTLTIGMNPDGSGAYQGEVECVLMFSGLLSTNQIQDVERALRWLEPTTQNFVFIGDSQMINWAATNQASAGNLLWLMYTDGIPPTFMSLGNNASVSTWWNFAYSGQTSSSWAPGGALWPVLTNALLELSPYGRVAQTTFVYLIGANDLGAGVTPPMAWQTTVANVSTTAAAIHSNGCSLWMLTQNRAGLKSNGTNWWSDSTDTNRVAYNQWLRNNPAVYDKLIDRDALFGPYLMSTNNGFTRDGIHPTIAGAAIQAAQIEACQNNTASRVGTAVLPSGDAAPLLIDYDPLRYGLVLDEPWLEGRGTNSVTRDANRINGYWLGLINSAYWTNCIVGNAIVTGPNGNGFNFGDTTLGIRTNFTVNVLFNTTYPSASLFIAKGPYSAISTGLTGGAEEWYIEFFPGGSTVYATVTTPANGAATASENSASIWDGNWHDVGMTYDGSNVKLWIDSTNYATTAQTGPVTNMNGVLNLGFAATEQFGPLKIFNRALSTNEMKLLYRSYFSP